MNKNVVCEECGKEFHSEHPNQKICDDCIRLIRNQRARENYYKRKKKNSTSKKPKKRKSQIENLNKEALKRGMTYGQYVAMQRAKEHAKVDIK